MIGRCRTAIAGLLTVIVLVLLTGSGVRRVEANHDAKRLYDDLLKKKDYNRLVRPAANSSDTLTVSISVKLSQIIDVVSGSCRCA